MDINLEQKEFVGIPFVLWSGGTWIKNNGSNFYISLKSMGSIYEKVFSFILLMEFHFGLL